MKMIVAIAAAALLSGSWAVPAVAMGQTQSVPNSNQPVPTADAQRAAAFNACVSRQYVAGQSSARDNAMGKYRDTYTLVTRSVSARNLPEFNRHLRDAQIQAADVGTTCSL